VNQSLNDKAIRPDKLMSKYSKLYENDVKLLKNHMITINCPACSSSNYKPWLLKMGFTFVECDKCSTVFVNPRPNEKSLEEFYTKSKSILFWEKIFKNTEKTRIEKIVKPRISLVQEILKKHGITCTKMVEVAAGYGWFCKLAKEQKMAEEIIAIEPSPSFASECRKFGIKVIESTIEKCPNELGADMIVCFELVHLLFNPRSFLNECYKKLKPNGMIIFSLTNLYGFDIQSLKEKSDYVIPTFLTLFNPESIQNLLHSIGFCKVEIRTPGLLDTHIVLNKLKENAVSPENHPIINFLSKFGNEEFLDDFQGLLQKHRFSSHMLVSAQK